MYATKIYLYKQKQLGIFFNQDSDNGILNSQRNRYMYSGILKATKGVDTVIEFQFLDQNQKPVNLESTPLTFELISSEDNSALLSKGMAVTVPEKGKATVTLSDTDLSSIDTQRAKYSVTRVKGGLTELAYVDDNAGTQGYIDILPEIS